jgi:hypothetical protein
MHAAE